MIIVNWYCLSLSQAILHRLYFSFKKIAFKNCCRSITITEMTRLLRSHGATELQWYFSN